jgi:hypothetical protein
MTHAFNRLVVVTGLILVAGIESADAFGPGTPGCTDWQFPKRVAAKTLPSCVDWRFPPGAVRRLEALPAFPTSFKQLNKSRIEAARKPNQ